MSVEPAGTRGDLPLDHEVFNRVFDLQLAGGTIRRIIWRPIAEGGRWREVVTACQRPDIVLVSSDAERAALLRAVGVLQFCEIADFQLVKGAVSAAGESTELAKHRTKRGRTLLHVACAFNELDAIKALVGVHHVDVDVLDTDTRRSALSYAAENGHTDAVKALLAAGCKTTFVNSKSFPLHYACSGGYADIVKAIVTHENAHRGPLSVNECDAEGRLCLSIACAADHLDVVRVLDEADHRLWANADKDGCLPMTSAVVSGAATVVAYAVGKLRAADVAPLFNSLLDVETVGYGHAQVARCLFTHMQAFDSKCMEATARALFSDHTSSGIVRLVVAAANAEAEIRHTESFFDGESMLPWLFEVIIAGWSHCEIDIRGAKTITSFGLIHLLDEVECYNEDHATIVRCSSCCCFDWPGLWCCKKAPIRHGTAVQVIADETSFPEMTMRCSRVLTRASEVLEELPLPVHAVTVRDETTRWERARSLLVTFAMWPIVCTLYTFSLFAFGWACLVNTLMANGEIWWNRVRGKTTEHFDYCVFNRFAHVLSFAYSFSNFDGFRRRLVPKGYFRTTEGLLRNGIMVIFGGGLGVLQSMFVTVEGEGDAHTQLYSIVVFFLLSVLLLTYQDGTLRRNFRPHHFDAGSARVRFTVDNSLQVASLILNFVQLSSFALLPTSFPDEVELALLPQLAFFGFGAKEHAILQLAVSIVLLIAWMMAAAIIVYAVLSRKFSATRLIPWREYTVPLLANILFLTVVRGATQWLDCVDDATVTLVPVPDRQRVAIYPEMICWEGAHNVLARFVIVATPLYTGLAIALGASFSEDVGRMLDLKVPVQYSVTTIVFSLLIVFRRAFGSGARLSISVIAASLWSFQALRRGQCTVLWFNTASIFLHLCIVWGATVSLVVHWIDDEDVSQSWGPFSFVVAGYVGLAILWVRAVQFRRFNVGKFSLYAPDAGNYDLRWLAVTLIVMGS